MPRQAEAIGDFGRLQHLGPCLWTVVSSGVLSRALQQAWPDAKFYGVGITARPTRSWARRS
eukprot:COSAG04_NODE_26867_length_289_cov_1.357895_1_plen_61_part_00